MCAWDALNANVNLTKVGFDEYRKMFESQIFAGATEKLLGCENRMRKRSLGQMTMGGQERRGKIAKRQITKVEQLHKVSTPCLDDNPFKKGRIAHGGGILSKVCSQILLKCLYM